MGIDLKGIFVPTVTPFTDDGDALDEVALRRLLRHLLAQGVAGIVACGGTGEFATLSLEERRRVMDIVADECAARVLLVPHTGAVSTRDTVELSRAAAAAGADALMIAPPYYDPLLPEELYAHYAAIANAVDLPIVLYNNPAATGVDLTADLIEMLLRIDQVRFVKDSTGDAAALLDLAERFGDRLGVINGADALALPALLGGASALIWGVANFLPSVCVRLCDLVGSGTGLQEAAALWRSLRPLITFLETQPSVATVKAGCEMVGFPVGPPRPPLLPLSPAQAATLAQLVDGLQVARSRVL